MAGVARLEVNESRIPVFVYTKESQLYNYVDFFESRIQNGRAICGSRAAVWPYLIYSFNNMEICIIILDKIKNYLF